MKKFLKLFFVFALLATIGTVGYFAWTNRSDILLFDQEFIGTKPKEAIAADLRLNDKQVLSESVNKYEVKDPTANGVEMRTASTTKPEEYFTATFPKAYNLPMTIDIGQGRIVEMVDKTSQIYEPELIYDDVLLRASAKQSDPNDNPAKIASSDSLLAMTGAAKSSAKDNSQAKYLRYKSDDGRKTAYYAYQRDTQAQKRKVKNWIYYEKGTGSEKETYEIKNARLRKDRNGNIEGYYYGEQQKQNDEARANVEKNLYDRAMLTLQKELGDDIDSGGQKPDFVIPRPFIIDAQGNRTELDWQLSDDKTTLAVTFTVRKDQYPLALDPTLQFTAPGQASEGNVIDGENANNEFGKSLAIGDFNADSRTDLAVGADCYPDWDVSCDGRVYLFYNDGSYVTTASTADVIITGDSNSVFGNTLAAGDFNADGRTDLVVGTGVSAGQIHVFYNDGNYPATASSADAIITGEAGSGNFGSALAAGDFNADGKTDLAVGAEGYDTSTGRIYFFYNDGNYPATASSADAVITGEVLTNFGSTLTAGDFNADGKTDLVVGAQRYNSYTGRAYLFMNDGNYPATASSADAIITGEATSNYFGSALTAGDFNADGKTDLAVGSDKYTTETGRAYIFYNDSNYPSSAALADITITGEGLYNQLGSSLVAGDFNADGKTDLLVGADNYGPNTGRAYLFYNDGSYPATASTADVIITGEAANNYFGSAMTAGDFNADGKTDLAVGSVSFSSATGRVYIFNTWNGVVEFNKNIDGSADNISGDSYFSNTFASGDFNADGKTDLAVGAHNSNTGRTYLFYNDGTYSTSAASADVIIAGEAALNYFGYALSAGDFNADGKTDLAVGAYGYSSNTGRAYLFVNDGSYPSTASTADVIITGQATNNNFGSTLTAGDFNADGKIDLAAGAYRYSSYTGRAYLFYNDGSYPSTASTADAIITGQATNNFFGYGLSVGDFNADGKTDLAAGAYGYSSYTGRAYLFYNDGSYPSTASTADAIITGQATSGNYGVSFAVGDFNADGKTDLAAGAYGYDTGRVYIFYNDGSYPSTASTADIIIMGETINDFSLTLTAGDFNDDGKIDLAVGARGYANNTGRAYLFYNDGNYPSTASTADAIITGEATNNFFGYTLTAGDFNADGKTDLAVGAQRYNTDTGRAYLFYNDGSYPVTASTADATITGETASNYFGYTLAAGDFNADGKTDLSVGAYLYNSYDGRIYIFYNDGSYTKIASTADVIITGETATNYFGYALTAGDFNDDGKIDLAVGAYRYNTDTGRAYLFYNDGSYTATASTADAIITGQAIFNFFGNALAAGDFNADGKTDLAVGAQRYNSYTGRVYLFYNDGSYTATASTADAIITGETSNNYLGNVMAAGDFNDDGKTDLAVGARGYAANTGRAYLFYNDGSYTATASTADAIITGEAIGNYFGYALSAGDFNDDGKIDLAAGAYRYSSYTGRSYIFYNDGSYTATASTADAIITGDVTLGSYGVSLAAGDFNDDGKTDLAVGADGYNVNTGRVYIFYNDGSYPSTASTADAIITGEETSNNFGFILTGGDFNADGYTDLVVGSYGNQSIYFITMKKLVTTLPDVVMKGVINAKGAINVR